MAIKLKQTAIERAKISNDFVVTVKDIARARYASLQAELNAVADWARPRKQREIDQMSMTMQNILGNGDMRSGAEFLATRLRGLRYTKFGIVDHNGRIYLAGRTHDVTVKYDGQMWSLGEYSVFIPVETLETGGMGGIHMVPVREHDCNYRHPHHYGNKGPTDNPLDCAPSTCWGTFATIISELTSYADIPELFGTIWIYLNIYNPGSPLRGMGRIGHKRLVE